MVKINGLRHGGIMANYQCNAACRHCLYACSPDRDKSYITKEAAEEVCSLLIQGGCRSVHIGGGEPFLDFEGLINLLRTIRNSGLRLEYVETNGFFAADEELTEQYLAELKAVGVDTLCISLDPFHAEYIPFNLPLKLAEICRRAGFGYFLWQERFLPSLAGVNKGSAQSRENLEKQISANYIIDTARSYGLSLGGRAINIEEEFEKPKPIAGLLKTKSCRHLLSSDHFHVDLYGNFIPPGCTGIALPLYEVLNGIPIDKYPAFRALTSGGLAELVGFAEEMGFSPEEEYTSSCVLCFYTRQWLSENADCPELDPKHYEAALSYY